MSGSDGALEINNESIHLPVGFVFEEKQCGGKHRAHGDGRLGILKNTETKRIWKHLPYARSLNEAEFYQSLTKNANWPVFIPRYHGLHKLDIERRPQHFIELDNITSDMRRPNILDIKLVGARKPSDTEEKLENRRHKYPLFENLGFCLDGCQLYDMSRKVHYRLSPIDTNESMDGIKLTLKRFLDRDWSAIVVGSVARQAIEVEMWMKTTCWQLNSSSLLIAYEDERVRVSLIDFGQAKWTDQVDNTRCIHGLQTFMKLMRESAG